MSNTTNTPSALAMVAPDTRELIVTASLDWLVANYIRYERKLVEHSSYEILMAAIAEHANAQPWAVDFWKSVEAY